MKMTELMHFLETGDVIHVLSPVRGEEIEHADVIVSSLFVVVEGWRCTGGEGWWKTKCHYAFSAPDAEKNLAERYADMVVTVMRGMDATIFYGE